MNLQVHGLPKPGGKYMTSRYRMLSKEVDYIEGQETL